MTQATGRTTRRRGAAFTLIEMLIVIAIIAILLAITTVAGVAIIRRNTVNTTQNLLTTLDRALDEYLSATGGVPPKYDPMQYSMVPGPDFDQPGDALNDFAMPNGLAFVKYPTASSEAQPRYPDAAVFLKQIKGIGAVDGVVQSIPTRFLQVTITGEGNATNPSASDLIAADPTPSVLDSWSDDGWKNYGVDSVGSTWPVRKQQIVLYVHPDNLLAQDLYGRCQNRRPYFMSAGPDKSYGTKYGNPQVTNAVPPETNAAYKKRIESLLDDNIYSYPGVAGTFNKSQEFFANTR